MKSVRDKDSKVRDQAYEARVSAAVAKWMEVRTLSSPFPAQGWLLKFRDWFLERSYLQSEYECNQTQLSTGLILISLAAIGIGFFDTMLVPESLQPLLKTVRTFVLVPATLLGILGTIFIKRVHAWFAWSTFLIGVYGVAHCVLILKGGDSGFNYLKYGIFEVTVGVFLLFGMPLYWSIAIILTYAAVFTVCAFHVGTDVHELANFNSDVIILFCFGAFATYKYELASRRQFIAQAIALSEYSEHLAADADRRRWLEVIAEFLRHELKNAMIGISTSIELADRENASPASRKYLDRGRQSIKFMRSILAQAAEATSLESALSRQEFEPIDLSALVQARMQQHKDETPHRIFELNIEKRISMRGNADSLVQMLDKLVDNALEHGAPAQPITVNLRQRERDFVLTVMDIGDALPVDRERIFEPFVSKKGARFGAGNLGLGLFVARTIAVHHGGTLRAEPLARESGAQFILEMPTSAA